MIKNITVHYYFYCSTRYLPKDYEEEDILLLEKMDLTTLIESNTFINLDNRKYAQLLYNYACIV